MGRKVAFVDIDGCLLIDGKLNPELVKKLERGGYDEIVLFTQRSMYMQSGQIPRTINQIYMENEEQLADAKDIKTHMHTTPQVIKALEKVLSREVKLSTSVDSYVGNKQPFGYKDELQAFEDELASKHIEYCEKYGATADGEEASQALAAIHREMKQKLNTESEAVRAGRQEEMQTNLQGSEPDAFYPREKIAQYEACIRALGLNKDDVIDYFDDSLENLKAVSQKVQRTPSAFRIRKSGSLMPLTVREKLLGQGELKPDCLAKVDSGLFDFLVDNFLDRGGKKQEYDYKFSWLAVAKDKLKHGSNARSRTSDLQLSYKLILLLRGEPIRPFTREEHLSMKELFPTMSTRMKQIASHLDEHELLVAPRKGHVIPDVTYTCTNKAVVTKELTATQALLADVSFYRQCKELDVAILEGDTVSPKHLAKIAVARTLETYLTELDKYERQESDIPPTLDVEPTQAKYAGGRIKDLLTEVRRLDKGGWEMVDEKPAEERVDAGSEAGADKGSHQGLPPSLK